MNYKVTELKSGIKLHTINTEKFKTNLVTVFLTTKLERKTVTKNSVISAVLRRGSKNMPTQEEISKTMEDMYGAGFDCGLEKTGDNQILKFYIETINDNYLPGQGEKMLKTALEKLIEIVFNPYTENGVFKKEYVEQEKNNTKQRIEGKVDNKARYALNRCVEEMYKDKPYGLYKFGYVEDLPEINEKKLYEAYQNLIDNCKIDILVSGKIDENIEKIVAQNENIIKLKERNPIFEEPRNEIVDPKQENVVTESMDVSQGKLVFGLNVNLEEEDLKYVTLVYNAILGGTATSKMFQNVREKAHLAYVASSSYLRHKNNIFINCGIEIANYEKALNLIKEQIQAMRDGIFSEEDIKNAKKNLINTIRTIEEEQDAGIAYCFGQEFLDKKLTVEEYIQKIKNVTKEEIVNIANKVVINTIYFLRD